MDAAVETLSPVTVPHPDAEDVEYIRPATLDKLTNPNELFRFINKTARLSDSDFEEVVHDIGWRVALWHMRSGALRGDIRLVTACDKYLDRVDAYRLRRSAGKGTNASPLNTGFTQKTRKGTPVVDSSE